MSSVLYFTAKGSLFTRSLLAGMVHGSFSSAAEATDTHPEVVRLLKANSEGSFKLARTKSHVDPMAINGDAGSLVAETVGEFIELADTYSAFNTTALPLLHVVPFNVRAPILTSKPTASWTGENRMKTAAAAAFGNGEQLTPHKVTTLYALTLELIKALRGASFDAVQRVFAQALGDAIDAQAFSANPATVDAPAGLLANAVPVDAAGDAVAGWRAAVAGFGGDFRRAVVVMNPQTAVTMASAETSGGSLAFPNAGLQAGANMGGVRIAPSSGVAVGDAVLLDQGGIAAAFGDLRVRVSDQGCIQLDSADATTVQSLWQGNLRGVLLERDCDWSAAPGSVVHITNLGPTA